ncbi:MAG: hypothetical protein AAF918_18915 [Pseudomonadota bacterium]
MSEQPSEHSTGAFADRVRARFGIFPNVFDPARSSEDTAAYWFNQAEYAYLDAPFPALFKDKLFVLLSRYAQSAYCALRHAAFLSGEGYTGGARTVVPLPVNEVMALLTQPAPTPEELTVAIKMLNLLPPMDQQWTESNSPMERALFKASFGLFINSEPQLALRQALRRALGPQRFQRLTTLLAYMRSVHTWTDIHHIPFDSDIVRLLSREPKLEGWLARHNAAQTGRPEPVRPAVSSEPPVPTSLPQSTPAPVTQAATTASTQIFDPQQALSAVEFDTAALDDDDSPSKGVRAMADMEDRISTEFSNLVRNAAVYCRVPVAMVSLVNAEDQQLASDFGAEEHWRARAHAFSHETARSGVECEWLRSEDERWAQSAVLFREAPELKYYYGLPIALPDGQIIGALSVFDTREHKLDKPKRSMLQVLADIISHRLKHRDFTLRHNGSRRHVTACAWCQAVQADVGGEAKWMSAYEFLQRIIYTTHGICPSCAEKQLNQ